MEPDKEREISRLAESLSTDVINESISEIAAEEDEKSYDKQRWYRKPEALTPALELDDGHLPTDDKRVHTASHSSQSSMEEIIEDPISPIHPSEERLSPNSLLKDVPGYMSPNSRLGLFKDQPFVTRSADYTYNATDASAYRERPSESVTMFDAVDKRAFHRPLADMMAITERIEVESRVQTRPMSNASTQSENIRYLPEPRDPPGERRSSSESQSSVQSRLSAGSQPISSKSRNGNRSANSDHHELSRVSSTTEYEALPSNLSGSQVSPDISSRLLLSPDLSLRVANILRPLAEDSPRPSPHHGGASSVDAASQTPDQLADQGNIHSQTKKAESKSKTPESSSSEEYCGEINTKYMDNASRAVLEEAAREYYSRKSADNSPRANDRSGTDSVYNMSSHSDLNAELAVLMTSNNEEKSAGRMSALSEKTTPHSSPLLDDTPQIPEKVPPKPRTLTSTGFSRPESTSQNTERSITKAAIPSVNKDDTQALVSKRLDRIEFMVLSALNEVPPQSSQSFAMEQRSRYSPEPLYIHTKPREIDTRGSEFRKGVPERESSRLNDSRVLDPDNRRNGRGSVQTPDAPPAALLQKPDYMYGSRARRRAHSPITLPNYSMTDTVVPVAQQANDSSFNISGVSPVKSDPFTAFTAANELLSDRLAQRTKERTPGRRRTRSPAREIRDRSPSGLENIPEPWQLNIEQAAPAPDEELLRRKSKIRSSSVGSADESVTTMESTHTESDDAEPPSLPTEALGSRPDPPSRSPGIYGTRQSRSASSRTPNTTPRDHPSPRNDLTPDQSRQARKSEAVSRAEIALAQGQQLRQIAGSPDVVDLLNDTYRTPDRIHLNKPRNELTHLDSPENRRDRLRNRLGWETTDKHGREQSKESPEIIPRRTAQNKPRYSLDQSQDRPAYCYDRSQGRPAYSPDCAQGRPAYSPDCAQDRSAYSPGHALDRSAYSPDHALDRSAYNSDHVRDRKPSHSSHRHQSPEVRATLRGNSVNHRPSTAPQSGRRTERSDLRRADILAAKKRRSTERQRVIEEFSRQPSKLSDYPLSPGSQSPQRLQASRDLAERLATEQRRAELNQSLAEDEATLKTVRLQSRLSGVLRDRQMTYHILREELMKNEDEEKARELELAWRRITLRKPSEPYTSVETTPEPPAEVSISSDQSCEAFDDKRMDQLKSLLNNPLKHLITKKKKGKENKMPKEQYRMERKNLREDTEKLKHLLNKIEKQQTVSTSDTSNVTAQSTDDTVCSRCENKRQRKKHHQSQGNGRKTREQLGTTTKTISPASDPSSSPIHRPSGQRRARHGYELSELRDAAVDAAIQIDAANKHDVATSPTREDNKQKSGKAKDVGVMCPTPHVASSQNESSEESETRHTPREDNPPAKQQHALAWYVDASKSKKNVYQKAKETDDHSPGLTWFIDFNNPRPWTKPVQTRRALSVAQEPWLPNGQSEMTAADRRNLNELNRQFNEATGRVAAPVSLQEAFRQQRQRLISASRERQRVIQLRAESRKMGSVHDEQRAQLFRVQLPIHQQEKVKMTKRVIPKHEMYDRTNRTYQALPEVKQQKKSNYTQRERQTFRLKAKLFNKKVQRVVLDKARLEKLKTRKKG